VVAVTRGSDPCAPLAEVADLSIAQGDRGSPDRRTVWVPDPLSAVAELEAKVAATPLAALTLTWLLRAAPSLSVPDALAAESAAYSTLLAGQVFRDWLARRGPARPSDSGERVSIDRVGDLLTITLTRPARRNAVDAAMRDALREALQVAEWDDRVQVLITGEGKCFSAGGDLDEFGMAQDPAAAHVVRVLAGVGEVLHRIRDRVTVRVHGTCLGAGMELPAFAGRVVAAADTQFALPEVAMGLIPGAGGTVSIPARIGAPRTLWLALTGAALDARTALDWGLVDAIE
jgi:hypothetical protein